MTATIIATTFVFSLPNSFASATSVFAEAEGGFFGVKLGGTAARPAAYAASIASLLCFQRTGGLLAGLNDLTIRADHWNATGFFQLGIVG